MLVCAGVIGGGAGEGRRDRAARRPRTDVDVGRRRLDVELPILAPLAGES